MNSDGGVRVAVDIGGTFTDIVVMKSDGVLSESKVSTTPDDPSRAVIDGVLALLRELDIRPGEVAEVLHGTTVGSNTILQRRGAKTGLVTTRGFRDVLEIGRIRMPEMFDLTWTKPVPLVPRRYRVEVDERIAADGTIVRPLDERSLLRAVEQLMSEGIEAVALCFINSYRNSIYERLAELLIKSRHPGVPVSASYAVLPEMKEYERTSTTVVNAYLLKVMQNYLDRLEFRASRDRRDGADPRHDVERRHAGGAIGGAEARHGRGLGTRRRRGRRRQARTEPQTTQCHRL